MYQNNGKNGVWKGEITILWTLKYMPQSITLPQ